MNSGPRWKVWRRRGSAARRTGRLDQQTDRRPKTVPAIAAEIAHRLLAAGRASAINTIAQNRPGWPPYEWETTRLAILEGLGRSEEAQAFRWACFER